MKNILFFLLFVVAFSSCEKNDANPTSTNLGKLKGNLFPIEAALTISATDTKGKVFNTPISRTDGSFEFDNLPQGWYVLSTTNNNTFTPLSYFTIEVTSGVTSNAGNITLERSPASKGMISGNLLPVGIGTNISIKNKENGQTISLIPNAQTGFFAANLDNGTYLISFKTISSTEPPKDIEVTVQSNAQNLGDIICKQGNSSTIEGKFWPVGSVTEVRATNIIDGSVVNGLIQSSTGTYKFHALNPGTYEISFVSRAPYLPIPSVNLDLGASKNKDLGTVNLTIDKDIRFVSYRIPTTSTIQYNVKGSFTQGRLSFSISKQAFVGGIPERMRLVTTTLSVAQGNITGPGKYTLTNDANSGTSITEKESLGISTWDLTGTNAKGELIITAIDPVAKTISGTFTATLISTKTPALHAKTITEGAFHLSY
ncbi:MAG: hypothetical protein EOO90_11295 [Pedobacter sp.]|nr:MAG: hypothetical protein EOO90_11295 [Pedobacter sp.]